MAPNLAASQHELIRDPIIRKPLKTDWIADVAACGLHSVNAIRSNLRCFGTTRTPFNGRGRPRSITPPILDTLREYLLGKPDLYLDEMMVFLWDGFEVLVTKSSNSRGCLQLAGQRRQPTE